MNKNLIYFGIFAVTVIIGMLYRYRVQRAIFKATCNGAPASADSVLKRWELLLWTLLISAPSVLLLSFRYGIGSDYFNYERIYENYILLETTNMEWGYQMLMKFSHWLFKEFWGVIFLCAFLSLVLIVYWILKNCIPKQIPIALLILLSMNMGIWFNTIRQGVAISLCAIALTAIKKSKFLPFLCLVILASLLHTTALVLLPCYFLLNHKNKKTPMVLVIAKLIVIAGLIFAFVYFYEIIGTENEWQYVGYYDSDEGGTTPWFLIFAIFILLPELFYLPRILQKNSKNVIFFFWVILELIFFVIGLQVSFVFRIAEYFSVVHILLIPEVLSAAKNRAEYHIVRFYYTLLFIFYFWYLYIYFGYSQIVPYVSIFDYV